MAAIEIEDLEALLSPGQTIAGLDLGTKTIGLAVSDLSRSLASPRPVIKRRKFTLDAIDLLAALKRDQVGAAVIGLPVNMDGSEGPRAQATRAFVRNMSRKNRPALRFLGRAAFDRGCGARADRNGCVAQEARRADRFGCSQLHSPGRA
jgi:hypothetical protein